jgi:hypothetical protein
MGYCCMPYRIDFKRLSALRGSRDQALFDRLRALALADIDEDDEDDEDENWDDDPEASQARVMNNPWLRAVSSILNGEPMPADAGKDYRFAVDLMCTMCGPLVASWAFKGGLDHLEAVERAIGARGLHDRVSLRRLLASGFPLPAPATAPMPEVGYMTAEQVAEARGLLRAQHWDDVSTGLQNTIREIDQAIEAAAQRGAALLGKVLLPRGGDAEGSMSAAAIDLRRLQSLPGSRNEAFFERVRFFVERLAEWTPEINTWDDETFLAWKRAQDVARAEDAAEDDRSEPRLVRAARSLLFGRRLNPELSRYYGEVLSLICMEHGRMLDNAAIAPAAPQHFTDVDEALEAHGLKERISMLQLVYGGPPITVPFDGDFPTMGHMSPEAVKAARGLIGTRDWSNASHEVRETVRLVDRWIAVAASYGQGLVCFYG